MNESQFAMVLKLVEKGDLNVIDRQRLGTKSVTVQQVKAALRILILGEEFYPMKPWTPGEPVYDGAILENKTKGYRVHYQKSSSSGLNRVIYQVYDFDNLDETLDKFIELEWKGNIAGIKIRE